MDVARGRVETRGSAAEVDVMDHGGAEPDQRLFEEDRREDEDIRQMLAAVIGVVVDEEIVGSDLVEGVMREAGPEGMADRSEL